ncbi:MAG: MBL fold metallo-hydrolase [Burkholderiales bacterium]|nr:MBL fold metallo-hydrolase [Phycisphaerae bacterium]
MKLLMDTGGIAGTNCFLVVDETTSQCVLFDAPDHTVGRLLGEIRKNGWQLIGLWLTHGHFDHVADHQVVRDAYPDAPHLIHKLDEPKLLKPNTRFFPLPFTIPAGRADGFVEDGQELMLGSLACRVIHTPGHAPGHVMFYFESESLLIGGDLIIGGAIGRYDLPDSNYDDLCNSIRKVMKLPLDTRLMPGHGDPSTLREELATNPFVKQITESM